MDILFTHEMPAGSWSVEEHFGRMSKEPGYERNAMLDREIIAGARGATTPRLHVFGHWHLHKSLDTDQPGHLLEGLGMNGDRLGNLIVWDSDANETYSPEVKWGPKK